MRKPQSNVTRGTPGMILLAFATLLLATSLVHNIQSRQSPATDEIQQLTGLGDASFYISLSGNDFYNPALVFDAAPKGFFRRSVNAVPRPDASMLRHGIDATGRFVVYTEARHGASAGHAPSAPRWFLKSGSNRYVEFGERKHWPAFKSQP